MIELAPMEYPLAPMAPNDAFTKFYYPFTEKETGYATWYIIWSNNFSVTTASSGHLYSIQYYVSNAINQLNENGSKVKLNKKNKPMGLNSFKK